MQIGKYNNMIAPIKYVHFNRIERTYPFSIHEHFEFLYVRKGSVTITLNGKEYLLHEGDFSLATPFACHRIHASENVSLDIFLPSPQILGNLGSQFLKMRPENPILTKDRLPEIIRLTFLSVCEKIINRYAGENTPSEFSYYVDAALAEQLTPYISVILTECKSIMYMEDIRLENLFNTQRALAYCADYFASDISRDSLAEACGLSLNAVSQIFANMGTTFREYLNTLRTTAAYNLLCNTNDSIKDIMVKCGYLNQGTFNQNFVAQYGKPPREIRNETKR